MFARPAHSTRFAIYTTYSANSTRATSPVAIASRAYHATWQARSSSTYRPVRNAASLKTRCSNGAQFHTTHDGDERFYAYYLGFRTFNKRARTGAPWIADLKAQKSRDSLRKAGYIDLDAVFQAQCVTKDNLKDALELYVAEGHQKAITEDRERYRRDQTGTKALRLMLEANLHEHVDFSAEEYLLRVLMHCLVGEGASDFVWDWLNVNYVPPYASDWPPARKNYWRSSAFRWFVTSTAYWQGMDDAINTWRVGVAEYSNTQNKTGAFVNLSGAAIYLVRHLCKPWSIPIKAANHEYMINMLSYWQKDLVARAYCASWLWLAHPTAPNAQPAYEFLQPCMTGSETYFMRLMNANDVAGNQFNAMFLISTAQRLNQESKELEARRVLDFGREHLPDFFAMKGVSTSRRDLNTYWSPQGPMGNAPRDWADSLRRSRRQVTVEEAQVAKAYYSSSKVR